MTDCVLFHTWLAWKCKTKISQWKRANGGIRNFCARFSLWFAFFRRVHAHRCFCCCNMCWRADFHRFRSVFALRQKVFHRHFPLQLQGKVHFHSWFRFDYAVRRKSCPNRWVFCMSKRKNSRFQGLNQPRKKIWKKSARKAKKRAKTKNQICPRSKRVLA